MIESRCGINCSTCNYKEETNCPGCMASEGKMFWGECELAKCSIDKNLDHCGQCNDFPCPLLTRFSYDPEHGDNGLRIENLKEQKAM